MKTVKDYLNELDTEKLVNTYVYMYPVDYEMSAELLDRTLREIKERHREVVRQLIERLSMLETTVPEDGHQGLLFVHRCIKDDFSDQDFSLVHIDELREKGVKVESYAYEMCPMSEIIGFFVAETPLTKRYIYELISNVLYEASYFGFEPEARKTRIDEIIDSLNEAEEDIKNGKYYTWEEVKKELEDEHGEPFDDERELHQKVTEATIAYNKHSFEKELSFIINSLDL